MPFQVDVLPGQPEQLSAAKPEDEHEDVPGVQRIVVSAGGLEEAVSLVHGPDRRLATPRDGHPHERGEAPCHEFFPHRGARRTAQHSPSLMHCPLGRQLLAALARSTAPRLLTLGVLALRAALTARPQLVQPHLDVADGQLLQLAAAEVRDDVETAEQVVVRHGCRRETWPDEGGWSAGSRSSASILGPGMPSAVGLVAHAPGQPCRRPVPERAQGLRSMVQGLRRGTSGRRCGVGEPPFTGRHLCHEALKGVKIGNRSSSLRQ